MRRLAAIALGVGVGAARVHAAPSVTTDVSRVHACLPDDDGGALAVTDGGLVAVAADGTPGRVWTASDGLPGTRLTALVRLGDELWLGGEGGAARLTRAGDALTIDRTVASKPVRDLARHDGALYLATWGGGVIELPRHGKRHTLGFTAGDRAGRARVAALALAGDELWVGTDAGLYHRVAGKLEPIALASPEPAVSSLLADGDTLWIASDAGLFARTGDGVRALGGGVLTRVVRHGDDLVVASQGDGLERLDRGRLVPLAGAPRGLALAETIATAGTTTCAGGLSGLWLRRGERWRAAALASGLPSNDLSALARDGDRLWLGSFDQGLAVREGGVLRRVRDRNLDLRVNAIAVVPGTAGSRVWVGTAAGLSRIDGDRVTRLGRADGLPNRHILALAPLRDGRLLVGTTSGAAIVGDGRPLVLGAKQGLAISNVWAVAEDDDGFLWLGTTTGLYRGTEAGEWTRLSLTTGELADDWVMALAPRGRSMWVGTYKGGVSRIDWDAGADLTALRASHVTDGWINPGGLTFVGDTLYAASMDGLRARDADGTWRAITGLPGRDTTKVVAGADALWVATRRGLASLHL